MQEFWARLEFWQAMVFTLSVLIPVGVIILVSKPYIKWGDKFVFGVNSAKYKGKGPAHANCPYNGDWGIILAEAIVAHSKTDRIDLIYKVEEQLAFVEEKLLIAKSMLINNYCHLLSAKNPEEKNITQNQDYKNYSFLVEMMLEKVIKDLIRTILRQNNLHKMPQDKLETYIKEKIEFLFQTGSMFMDSHYNGENHAITREELATSVRNLRFRKQDGQAGLDSILEDIFRRGKEIALQKEEEIRQVIDSFEKKFVQITGISTL